MTENVLTVPAKRFEKCGAFAGFKPFDAGYFEQILRPKCLVALPRDEAEGDERYLQIVPYVVFVSHGLIFHYERPKVGGESRLQRQWSVGIGGHLNDADLSKHEHPFFAGMARELAEEVEYDGGPHLQALGFIHDPRTAVGRVHLGVCYQVWLDEPKIRLLEDGPTALGWESWQHLWDRRERFETWSRICLEAMRPE